MKAKVSYKDICTGNRRTKTIEVEKNEPNAIIRKFVEVAKESKYTHISQIKCGRYVYEWNSEAKGAFAEMF